jgi:alpha-galactosidase
LQGDPTTEPLLVEILDADGKPKTHEQIGISYLSSDGVKQGRLTTGYGASEDKIGPELTFGICLQQTLDEPILIIKTAWGGKSLHTDFRPPSAGPFRFREDQLTRMRDAGNDVAQIQAEKVEATGRYYRLMLDHVRLVLSDISQVAPGYDEQTPYELAGFVWFQGWNDMVDGDVYPERGKPGGYDQYRDALAHFIRDIRRDLDAPQLPIVIGVLGVGGPTAEYGPDQQRYAAIHQSFRDAMAAPAALPEFAGRVVAVLTEQYWDQELTALRSRQEAIRRQARQLATQRNLDEQAARRLEAEMLPSGLSSAELQTLATGISNAEYHYLGSGRILARIGQGFAMAMARLVED